MNKLKVGILSLGCPRNTVDTEYIAALFKRQGHSIVDMDQAQIGVLNTCAFVEDAKRESIDAILELIELKKQGKLEKIFVYGCLAQRYKDTLRRQFPQVDAFFGSMALEKNIDRFAITPKHYAYLKVCEGCLSNCSFCVIPKIKGKFTSLALENALAKAYDLEKQGIAELNIIGQDTSGYGMDIYGKPMLSKLLQQLCRKTKHINWFRLLYLYPCRVTDDLLKVIRDEPKVCKYIDLPIQHINSRILRLMRRSTRKKDILGLVVKIRKIIPAAAIRTSVIVGFPSETDAEFKELLDFIQECKFERLGAFVYSREEDTPAYSFKGQIPQKVKEKRFDLIMSEQQKISTAVNEKFLHTRQKVLLEECKDGLYTGRSQYDAPEVDGLVYVKTKRKLKLGSFVDVTINDTLEYDLVGEV